ncbi:hypothetical protein SAMN05519103_01798 [Rhizobiales bacterium GAS113]|nr:hypothetical protein SAMN05519103_01798 [Rhizobiales bacterium GAS113]
MTRKTVGFELKLRPADIQALVRRYKPEGDDDALAAGQCGSAAKQPAASAAT